MKTIVVCSGGLDSVSLAHRIAAEHELLALISFDYGQRHKKELDHAADCAARLGVPHEIIDISAVGGHLSGSALTDAVDVPDGHYAEDTMKVTVVPNRNAIMLAIAFGVAAARQADAVAVAVHGGDHFIYPDCRPGFIDAFQVMQDAALDGYAAVRLYAPYVKASKADIVTDGARHGTPFERTWSCYKGGERHCGRCGTCVER
ncbi:MAG TPA: 7-cyano-7-deazaguanine synthase QueC, partial [Rhizobium sp.]|nr:7-cyano-7-deazaguanine synthase QueC [Rhizobium sp.]